MRVLTTASTGLGWLGWESLKSGWSWTQEHQWVQKENTNRCFLFHFHGSKKDKSAFSNSHFDRSKLGRVALLLTKSQSPCCAIASCDSGKVGSWCDPMSQAKGGTSNCLAAFLLPIWKSGNQVYFSLQEKVLSLKITCTLAYKFHRQHFSWNFFLFLIIKNKNTNKYRRSSFSTFLWKLPNGVFSFFLFFFVCCSFRWT